MRKIYNIDSETERKRLFNEFKEKYSKTYKSDTEEATRFKYFIENIRNINKKNTFYNGLGDNNGAVFGINHLCDISPRELCSCKPAAEH